MIAVVYLYHEVYRQAMAFLVEHSRPNEFKKICDIFRNNYQVEMPLI